MAATGSMSHWPVMVGLAEVARGPIHRDIVADEEARRRIAKALGLLGLERLEGQVTVRPWLDGAEVEGRWSAAATQACVVTLEPLSSDLKGDFVVRVVPAGSAAAPSGDSEVELSLQDDDPPDVLEDDRIDIGHYVVEHLALEIDPFPRAPGAEFIPPEPEEPPSPFAVLRRLKDPGPEG